jgi:Right handed beta helix region
MNRQRRSSATWTIRWALAIVAAGVLIVPATEAATIRVAIDGSGDFTLVADGVLAAASGDTVTIGPGVYPEIRTFDTPGGLADFLAIVYVAELTIIGDGPDTVILGPESPAANLELGPSGIATAVTGNARIRGLTLRNLASGIEGVGNWIEVDNCRFLGNYFGVQAILTGFATVRNSEFIDNTQIGIIVFAARGGTGALVEGCQFRNNRIALDFQPAGCEVRDSTFEGGIVGVQVSFGGIGRVERCTFDGMLNIGVGIIGGSQGFVYDCTFLPTMAVNINLSGRLVGSGNELLGGTFATVLTTYNSVVEFNNNHILNFGGHSVEASNGGSPPIRTQDFTNNYWGTTDTAQIDAWIHDLNDQPIGNYILVDYTPLAEQPIPVESTSFGELKARYGQDE